MYKGLLTLVRALQLLELKLSGSIANIEQNNILCKLTSILTNLNNFHSLEVVDRVSETQLQVGENSN